MLSGIGPGANLRSHGIEVIKDAPGVGANLQDHVDFILLSRSKDTDMLGLSFKGVADIIGAILQWRSDGTGFAATPGAEGGAFLKTRPDLKRPDVQLHFVAGLVDDHLRKIHFGHGYSCHVCVLRPHSRGDVQLNNADPMSPPRIDPNYFSDERDMAAMIAGVRLTQRIMAAPSLAKYRHKDIYLTGNESDGELEQHIRSRADTIYHPVGTCRMGSDKLAVVDPQLKVRGVEGLRVIDASVMPTLIGGNTNAPTIMIAERASELIRAGF
jgi:choline dehydrogenase-like flavoprotein